MTEHIPSFDSPSVREQAVQWIVRLHSGSATSIDRDRLDAWLGEHPQHRREFEQVTRMWGVLDGAKPLLETEIDNAENLWAQYTPDPLPTSRSIRWPSRWPSGGMALTGALATLLIITGWWWLTGSPKAMLYQTTKGEQRQIALADGSSVMLNTETKMTVQFSDKTRLVRLDQGEAWFTVIHDESRPFDVQVANGIIHDIGTQFIVSKSPQTVKVSVFEGVVEVGLLTSRTLPAASSSAILHRGEQVSYGTDGRLSEIGSFNQLTVGAWKEGKLIFQAQPLQQVLAEIARYRSEEIRLLDPSLKEIPVSGVFNIQDLDSFIHILQDALPITVQRINANLVIVERAPAPPIATTAPHR